MDEPRGRCVDDGGSGSRARWPASMLRIHRHCRRPHAWPLGQSEPSVSPDRRAGVPTGAAGNAGGGSLVPEALGGTTMPPVAIAAAGVAERNRSIITENRVNLQPKPCQTNRDSIGQASIEITHVPADPPYRHRDRHPSRPWTRRRLLDRGPIVAPSGCTLCCPHRGVAQGFDSPRPGTHSARMTAVAAPPSRRALCPASPMHRCGKNF